MQALQKIPELGEKPALLLRDASLKLLERKFFYSRIFKLIVAFISKLENFLELALDGRGSR